MDRFYVYLAAPHQNSSQCFILTGFTTDVLRHCFSIPTVANHPAYEIAFLNRCGGLVSEEKRHTKTRQNHIVISLRLNRTLFLCLSSVNNYFSSSIASAQACCERYSFGHWISSDFHEMPESVEQNIPRLLAT